MLRAVLYKCIYLFYILNYFTAERSFQASKEKYDTVEYHQKTQLSEAVASSGDVEPFYLKTMNKPKKKIPEYNN